jgi:hypothetical protein
MAAITHTISVTDTSATYTFPHCTDWDLNIVNDGPDEAYIRFDMGPATTSDFPLNAGEFLNKSLSVSALALVCAASETATVRVAWAPRGR